MFNALAIAAINRLLDRNAWALEMLRPHAGKVVQFTYRGFPLTMSVTSLGRFTPAEGIQPDLTIALDSSVLVRAVHGDEALWNAARVTGDTELAGAIDTVRRNIRWDYEEDLSRLVGDIAAHRIGSAARELARWGREAALDLSRSVAEYATYENPLVATADTLDEFNSEVDRLRDDTARLEKRVELLQRSKSGAH